MKKTIRHYFPGGNTPLGFYSYYDNILLSHEAKRIFCIKGGPGTGKSTLMKDIGRHFESKGSDVDYLWCSADPDSLDGVVFRNKKVAIIDGTAPHIVDPKNPGAVDEIINLGECWDEEILLENRNEIISLNNEISIRYKDAYEYLKAASQNLGTMEKNIVFKDDNEVMSLIEEMIKQTLKDNKGIGTSKSFFASAITYKGFVNTLDEIKGNMKTSLVIKAPVGIRIDHVIDKAADTVIEMGYEITKFYCPMKPKKPEHLITDDCSFGLFSYNEYHEFNGIKENEVIDLETITFIKDNDIYSNAKAEYETNLRRAISKLKEAKELHDALEEYYIPAMDFEKVAEIKDRIISKVESISF